MDTTKKGRPNGLGSNILPVYAGWVNALVISNTDSAMAIVTFTRRCIIDTRFQVNGNFEYVMYFCGEV